MIIESKAGCGCVISNKENFGIGCRGWKQHDVFKPFKENKLGEENK